MTVTALYDPSFYDSLPDFKQAEEIALQTIGEYPGIKARDSRVHQFAELFGEATPHGSFAHCPQHRHLELCSNQRVVGEKFQFGLLQPQFWGDMRAFLALRKHCYYRFFAQDFRETLEPSAYAFDPEVGLWRPIEYFSEGIVHGKQLFSSLFSHPKMELATRFLKNNRDLIPLLGQIRLIAEHPVLSTEEFDQCHENGEVHATLFRYSVRLL